MDQDPDLSYTGINLASVYRGQNLALDLQTGEGRETFKNVEKLYNGEKLLHFQL